MRICCSSGVGWRKEATFFCFMSGSIKNCGRLVPQNHSMPSLLAAFRYRKTRPSVGWMGEIFDCDFNQMLKMQVRNGKPLYLWGVTPARLEGWDIQTGVHCLACTAGCGSSCTGAVSNPLKH